MPRAPTQVYAPLPTQASELPPGRIHTAWATMAAAAVLYVAWTMGVLELSETVAASAETEQKRMIVSQLCQTAGAYLGDAALGPLELAGAVGVSAYLARAPVRSVSVVAWRLWGPYAALKLAFTLGLIFLCPGIAGGLALLVFADPIGRGEARGPGFRVPRARTAVAMLGLGVVWGLLQTPMQLGGSVWVLGQVWPVRLGTYAVVEAVNVAGMLAWCVLARRSETPTG